jgi:hypothetical protein
VVPMVSRISTGVCQFCAAIDKLNNTPITVKRLLNLNKRFIVIIRRNSPKGKKYARP